MTVREFASRSKGNMILRIIKDDALLMYFDTAYWKYVTDDVLDLEIETFEVNNQLMKNAIVGLYITSDLTEEDSGQDEDGDDGEP